MVDIDKLGLRRGPTGIKPVSHPEATRNEFIKSLGLDYIYTPRVYLLSLHKLNEQWFITASLPKGQILWTAPKCVPPVEGRKLTKFVYLDHRIGLPQFRKRVKMLSYLSHLAVENGLSNKALKAFKRLSMVGCKAKFETFAGLCNFIFRDMKRGGCERTRKPGYTSKRCYYPSLKRSGKSTNKRWPEPIPLWDWVAPRRKPARISWGDPI